MKPWRALRVSTEGARKTKPREWLLRFAFGGAVSTAAGLIAREWGPVVGGVFLGFPAILPATVTLVKKYHGRAEAADDSWGAVLGSVGLLAFAAVAFLTIGRWSLVAALGAATATWVLVSALAWKVFG